MGVTLSIVRTEPHWIELNVNHKNISIIFGNDPLLSQLPNKSN